MEPEKEEDKQILQMVFGVWLSNVDGNGRVIPCCRLSYLAEAVDGEFLWSQHVQSPAKLWAFMTIKPTPAGWPKSFSLHLLLHVLTAPTVSPF